MPYIDKTDLLTFIRLEVLDQVTDGDDNLITTASLIAESEAAAYVRQRYDTPVEFSRTGTARSQLFVSIVCDITIYRLHGRVDPVQISNWVVNRYNGNHDESASWGGAIKTLMMVQQGAIDIDLPKISPSQNRPFEGGSNPVYSANF